MNQPAVKNPMDAPTVITAALVISAIGALFYNVLPIYVGAAQDYRGLDNQAVGFLSSAYFLGFNLVTISAFFWIRRISWALIAAVATPIAAISMSAGAFVSGYIPLLVTTAIAGGAFAALYGVGTTILSDVSNPARWYGVKIAVEALPGVFLLLLLPGTAIVRWGFDGAIVGIVVVLVFLSPLLFWIPAAGNTGSNNGENVRTANAIQSSWIWFPLLATMVFFCGASAMWAFVERIANQGGFAADSVGLLLAVTLVFAVLGSLMAATIGGRFGNVRPFCAGGALFLLSIFALHEPQSFAIYAVGACLLTFSFGFMIPIAVTEVADLDVDGRFIVLSVPAIGIGAMTGPGIAGVLSQSGSFNSMLAFGAASIVLACIFLAVGASFARRVTGEEIAAEI